jgi:hypothetical protein
MFVYQAIRIRTGPPAGWSMTIVGTLALVLCFVAIARPQSGPNTPTPSHPPVRHNTVFHTVSTNPRARDFYQLVWGIDKLNVKAVESGQMIRFSYLVLDAKKAAELNDKKAAPYLIDEKASVKLVVPTMEKVGQLRQSSTPEAGRSYWMVFSNKGRVVKPGDSVSIVIGKFRVNGLFVQ